MGHPSEHLSSGILTQKVSGSLECRESGWDSRARPCASTDARDRRRGDIDGAVPQQTPECELQGLVVTAANKSIEPFDQLVRLIAGSRCMLDTQSCAKRRERLPGRVVSSQVGADFSAEQLHSTVVSAPPDGNGEFLRPLPEPGIHRVGQAQARSLPTPAAWGVCRLWRILAQSLARPPLVRTF